jgi:hypothetical protein
MNALAKPGAAPAHVVVAGVALPPRTRWLADAMRDAADPHPDVGFQAVALRPGVREEAQRQLAALDTATRAATADDWLRFLLPFAILPKAPQGREALTAAAGPIAFALAGVPAVLLSPDLQRAGLVKLRWWPTPADIAELLAEPRKALARERAALARIAEAPAAAPRASLPDDLRAQMAEQMRARAAEIRRDAAEREGTRGPVKALPISDGHRLAMFEAAAENGSQVAAFAAAALRAKIEAREA